jgi:hypothetical protein
VENNSKTATFDEAVVALVIDVEGFLAEGAVVWRVVRHGAEGSHTAGLRAVGLCRLDKLESDKAAVLGRLARLGLGTPFAGAGRPKC